MRLKMRIFGKGCKAQNASLDYILSVVSILLFVMIVLAAIPLLLKKNSIDITFDQMMFDNIQDLRASNPDIAFLSDHKVNKTKLGVFADQFGTAAASIEDMERIVLSGSERFHYTNSDICIFFMESGQFIKIEPDPSVKISIGMTYEGDPEDSPAKKICLDGSNPCEFYRESYAFSRPVVMENDEGISRIMNMYILVCVE